VPLTNTSSTALVLFRPPLIQGSKEGEEEESKEQEVIAPAPSRDDDAMDVEP